MKFHKTFTGYCNDVIIHMKFVRMSGMVIPIKVCHIGFRYTGVIAIDCLNLNELVGWRFISRSIFSSHVYISYLALLEPILPHHALVLVLNYCTL